MIQKLTLRQRDLAPARPHIATATLVSPGQEGELSYPPNGIPSQLVQLDLEIGPETHRIQIHLPTPGHNKTHIIWSKL